MYIKKKVKNVLNRQRLNKSNIVIVVGGDGFMLQTLKKNKNTKNLCINSGSYGFLMNKFSEKNMLKYISKSKSINIFPLEMTANAVAKKLKA